MCNAIIALRDISASYCCNNVIAADLIIKQLVISLRNLCHNKNDFTGFFVFDLISFFLMSIVN